MFQTTNQFTIVKPSTWLFSHRTWWCNKHTWGVLTCFKHGFNGEFKTAEPPDIGIAPCLSWFNMA